MMAKLHIDNYHTSFLAALNANQFYAGPALHRRDNGPSNSTAKLWPPITLPYVTLFLCLHVLHSVYVYYGGGIGTTTTPVSPVDNSIRVYYSLGAHLEPAMLL